MKALFIPPAVLPRTTAPSSRKSALVITSQQDAIENTESKPLACPSCGRANGEVRGCDGNGRIIGGLGAVLKWWPIKAYRPCPDFINAKKIYRRAGQSLDEIAFGRKGTGDDLSISDRLRKK